MSEGKVEEISFRILLFLREDSAFKPLTCTEPHTGSFRGARHRRHIRWVLGFKASAYKSTELLIKVSLFTPSETRARFLTQISQLWQIMQMSKGARSSVPLTTSREQKLLNTDIAPDLKHFWKQTLILLCLILLPNLITQFPNSQQGRADNQIWDNRLGPWFNEAKINDFAVWTRRSLCCMQCTSVC